MRSKKNTFFLHHYARQNPFSYREFGTKTWCLPHPFSYRECGAKTWCLPHPFSYREFGAKTWCLHHPFSYREFGAKTWCLHHPFSYRDGSATDGRAIGLRFKMTFGQKVWTRLCTLGWRPLRFRNYVVVEFTQYYLHFYII